MRILRLGALRVQSPPLRSAIPQQWEVEALRTREAGGQGMVGEKP